DAITLNSVQFNLARAVGPALAGLLYGAIGPAGCFGVNASGFLVLAVVISRLHLPSAPAAVWQPPLAHALREGVGYVRRHPAIGPAMFLAAVMSLFGFPYIIMMPALASDVLGLDATGLGWLMAAVGAGAVTGGVALSVSGERGRSPSVTTVGSIVFGLAVLGFDRVRTPYSMATLLFVLGALQTITIASLTTIIQLHVHDGMRGRVMSMLTVIFFGFATLGGVIAGTVGDRIAVPRARAVAGGGGGGWRRHGAGGGDPGAAARRLSACRRFRWTRSPRPAYHCMDRRARRGRHSMRMRHLVVLAIALGTAPSAAGAATPAATC